MSKTMKAWMTGVVVCLVIALAIFLVARQDAGNAAAPVAGTGPAENGAGK